MALTQPFINTISAFNANVGTSLSVNILGGDAITGYQFFISPANSQTILYQSGIIQVQSDIAGATIRSYPINITSTMGLQNNQSYGIYCQTYSATQPNGQIGQTALFECYTSPSVKLRYLTSSEIYSDLSDGAIIGDTSQTFQIYFDNNDLNSIAQPNITTLTLYGVDASGNSHLITTTNSVYNFTHTTGTSIYSASVVVDGFSINIDSPATLNLLSQRLYDNFTLEVSLFTVENMKVTQTYTGLNCYYDILASHPNFDVYNLCNQGIMQITCNLKSLQGTSNIPLNELVYINNEELDLRASTYSPGHSEAWARWSQFFTFQQPYTLNLWGRNFGVGTILQFSHTLYIGNYLRLEYNNDGTNVWISLYSGQNNSNGNPMFPYYIESVKIPSTNITETTNLFIGVQQENGLFNLDFQILN